MGPSTPRGKAQQAGRPAANAQHGASTRDAPPAAVTVGGPAPPSFLPSSAESKRYTVHEVIGKGSYGTVCAATDNLTGERVAIKRISNVFDNVADAVRILREIKLLRLLRHPDVVQIKHIMLPSDPRKYRDIYVVFELMESDLYTVINVNDDLSSDHYKVFMYQLLRGLGHMHEHGVLHRDLKPRNILVNSNCKVKICDFGLARPFLGGNTPCAWTDYIATRWYRAPELCGCFYGRYSTAVDVWSIGCIFAEVLQGKPLFPGRDAVSQLTMITDLLGKPPAHIIDRISNRKARAFLHAMPDKPGMPLEVKFPTADTEALQLLRGLLAFDASERLTAAQALKLPYFKDLPAASFADASVITNAQFGFEAQQLNEADVRDLIYSEVLNYHPEMMAQYVAGSCRLPRQLSGLALEMGGHEAGHVKGQFIAAGAAQAHQQQQQYQQQAWKQMQQQAGTQQVAAYRPAMLPQQHIAAAAAAAAAAAQQQQQHQPMAHQQFLHQQSALTQAASAAAVQAVREHAAMYNTMMQYSPQYVAAYSPRLVGQQAHAMGGANPHMMLPHASGVASFV
eukprot:355903-Chlamydomonas_euryale.AAC.14